MTPTSLLSQAILRKILRIVAVAACGWLLRKGVTTAEESADLQNQIIDLAPSVGIFLLGAGADLWIYIRRFKGIAKVQSLLGVLPDGKPLEITQAAAADIATTAKIALQGVIKPSVPVSSSPNASLLLFLLIPCFVLSGCVSALTPPISGTAPTPEQKKLSGELQAVASAIRHAENAGFTPEQFNAFLETYVALLPMAGPYIPDAEMTYSLIYNAGNLSAGALEKLAARYDS